MVDTALSCTTCFGLGLFAGDPEPAVKHAVKTASRAPPASCRLVFLCSSHAGEASCWLGIPHYVLQAGYAAVLRPRSLTSALVLPRSAADTLKQAETQHTILSGSPADLLQFLKDR